VLFIILDDTGFGQLGCYGSPINTPNLNALAADGLRYNNMHTTALCSPSRSCFMTGRNHHSNAMACITEGSEGFPGSNGQIPFENGFLSEILLQHGYNTYALGKWHLTPSEANSAAGPYDRWPLGRGFERYYGFLGGGRTLPFSFWRRFVEIENVVAIKIAPFNRYQTIDVMRAVAEAGRSEIALYTGNDDNILLDLLTPYQFQNNRNILVARVTDLHGPSRSLR
jgi:arylsulfatase A-like enzyme